MKPLSEKELTKLLRRMDWAAARQRHRELVWPEIEAMRLAREKSMAAARWQTYDALEVKVRQYREQAKPKE